ncbi:hypothetical protein [Pseudooceanicola onchidii]|uniref:hypothetical protein n=1 Tax=Pseudooceanicola onchidii TaxID=2562279 RepID=UPI0010AA8BDF|nr:hypothetical protein [Pseudooceanicola onchidii]
MKVILTATVAGCFVTMAQAETMGFDALPDYFVDPSNQSYSENGIQASAPGGHGTLAAYSTLQAAHVDDSGSDLTDRIVFTMSGRFSAVSFDILPLSSDYYVMTDTYDFVSGTYDNVFVEGWRAGARVAYDRFSMGTVTWTYSFGATFTDLDSLIIGGRTADLSDPGECWGAPCAHFDIDNITLQMPSVPLPAGLPLLLMSLGGLMTLRRRG